MKIKQWEYKTIYLKKYQKQLDICLSDYGGKGWELVNLDKCFQLQEDDKLSTAKHLFQLIFKRPKYDK